MNTDLDRRLKVSRTFNANIERVYHAWLDPALIGKWLFATTGGQMVTADVDPKVGGGFTIIEKRGENLAKHFGTFVQLEYPRKIAFDFWTSFEPEPTRVEVTIQPLDSGSALTLELNIAPKWVEFMDKTRDGWNQVLENLARALGEGSETTN